MQSELDDGVNMEEYTGKGRIIADNDVRKRN